ncbi:polysaccharide deacetylase family protein [Marinilactibacillus psychrotolerans]|uniref:Polysaccharide deacetylase family protein n=1 Tax=Marinilactibacillus psychrotolerans TaxID=191770 RepID=A0A5R9C6E1_9LACT|nr:polysaccharide deacetylase family protein [Marinilactibacillus psychrotolerans]TLQ08673.1 polysaccharide deacetylase family protein [Marinilactibacillus psychrotolerans]
MKKTKYAFLFTSVLLLTACGSNEDTDTSENEQAAVDSETKQNEPETEKNETNSESEEEISEEEPEVSEEEEKVEFQYQVNTDNYAYIKPIEDTDANKQVALLTYDDAPDKHALEIAESLVDLDARAIFFVNGMYLEDDEGKETIKKIHDMGFEIGNHSQTHASLPDISQEEQYDEIVKTSDLVEEATGERPRFFRAPFGSNTDYSTELAHEQGMELMNWTYGYDWNAEYQDAEALTDIMLNTELLVPGSNLLMHDREWTMEATPNIVKGLREKDYEIIDPALIKSVDNESEDSQ